MSFVAHFFRVFHDKYLTRLNIFYNMLKVRRRVHGQFNMMFYLTRLGSAFYFYVYE